MSCSASRARAAPAFLCLITGQVARSRRPTGYWLLSTDSARAIPQARGALPAPEHGRHSAAGRQLRPAVDGRQPRGRVPAAGLARERHANRWNKCCPSAPWQPSPGRRRLEEFPIEPRASAISRASARSRLGCPPRRVPPDSACEHAGPGRSRTGTPASTASARCDPPTAGERYDARQVTPAHLPWRR